jgi:hypothetical protein
MLVEAGFNCFSNAKEHIMFATTQKHSGEIADMLRWTARTTGIALAATWVILVAAEMTRPMAFAQLAVVTVDQGVALCVVFAGYAVGWRHELAGGAMAIIGTLAYVAVVFAGTMVLPNVATLWFAAPGVLYLLARHYDHQRVNPVVG